MGQGFCAPEYPEKYVIDKVPVSKKYSIQYVVTSLALE